MGSFVYLNLRDFCCYSFVLYDRFMNPIMLVVAAVAKGGNWWAPQRRRGADPVSLFLSLSIGLPLVACRSREGGALLWVVGFARWLDHEWRVDGQRLSDLLCDLFVLLFCCYMFLDKCSALFLQDAMHGWI